MADVNLKVPALEKLLECAASGIGAVAGPMLASWKARREAKARRIETEGEADRLKLITDATAEARRVLVPPDTVKHGTVTIGPDGITQRIEFQEKKRQANIVSVVTGAVANLGDKEVPDREPDPDWTARFFDCAQDVSSRDMQKLWSQLLSGEVESPGQTSLRTLDVLRNMTSEEAQKFQDACSYVSYQTVILYFTVYDASEMAMNYPEIACDNLFLLRDAGLINAEPTTQRTIRPVKHEDYAFIPYHDLLLKISPREKRFPLDIPCFLLTSAGRELLQFTKCEARMDYLESFSRWLRSRGFELSYAHVLKRRPDGDPMPSTLFHPIDPDSRPPEGHAPR